MPPTEQISRGLSIREFAEINGISVHTARRAVYEGRIFSYRVGGSRRIPASYLQNLQQGYDATIRALVDAAPKLSAAQRDKLAALLAEDGDA